MDQDDEYSPAETATSKPWGFAWRAHPLFAVFTVGIGVFTDAFLYGLVVPILPSILEDHVGIPKEKHQLFVSELLSSFAAASVVFSPLAGALTDKTKTRQAPFLAGLVALIIATVLLFTARTIALLTVARVLQGASTALVWTVGLAMCRDTVGTENLGKTTGSIFGFVSVGTVFAPMAGGVLYSRFGVNSVAALALSLLGIDLVMRVFVIEKHVARKYLESDTPSEADWAGRRVDEYTSLIANGIITDEDDTYLIPKDQPHIIQEIPILYCFNSPSLVLAMCMMLVQGIFLGSFDATIPLHARSLFGFNSLESGLLFAPLGLCNLLSGPIAGWVVDRIGTRPVATIGYIWLIPVLAVFRIPSAEPRTEQIVLYAVILGLAGIGLGAINSPAIVEAGLSVERYHLRNPDFFGPNGPYAQLYGISNMMFCIGLTAGPALAGGLRVRIGYGNMNAVLAGISAVVALMCFIFLNKKQK